MKRAIEENHQLNLKARSGESVTSRLAISPCSAISMMTNKRSGL
jgi:hypothetical protein